MRLTASATAVALLAAASAGAQEKKAAETPRFGVNYVYQGIKRDLRGGAAAKEAIAGVNRRIADMGVKWIRSAGRGDPTSLNWANVEPRDGEFDFALHDLRIADAQSRGLLTLGSVDFSTVPAHADVGDGPFDEAKYLRYLNKIVERYDGDGKDDMPGLAAPVRYWEIGNEVLVNTRRKSKFDGGPEDYARTLRVSFEAIKAQRPDLVVVIGGWIIGKRDEVKWRRSLDYLERVLSAGGAKWFDVMNYHEYTEECDYLTYFHVGEFNRVIDRQGPRKPMWITEANTILEKKGHVNSMETQSRDVVKRVVVAFDAGVEVFFWHGLDDEPGGPGPGLYDEKGELKPCGQNLRLLISKVGGFKSVERVDMRKPEMYVYRFDTGAADVFVAWTEGGDGKVDLSGRLGAGEVESIRCVTEPGGKSHETGKVPAKAVPLSGTPLFLLPAGRK